MGQVLDLAEFQKAKITDEIIQKQKDHLSGVVTELMRVMRMDQIAFMDRGDQRFISGAFSMSKLSPAGQMAFAVFMAEAFPDGLGETVVEDV